MPSAQITLTVRNAGLTTAYRKQFATARQQTSAIVGQTVNRVGDKALSKFREEPPLPGHPIKWNPKNNYRQRKAYFATKGFGRGIGAPRTHDLSRGYKLTIIYSADQLPQVVLTNPVPYRRFVTGNNQQPMHKGRWFRQATLTRQLRVELTGELETALIKNLFILDVINE